jgi:Zn-dependent alcohol dehydrogenase
VRLHYSGICGAQINEIDAVKGPDKFLPHLLGHEGSGVVQKTGPGVTTVKEGDHVVLHWRPSAGLQATTPDYWWNGKKVNAGWVTTCNEEAVISENRLTVIPDNFDMRLATLFGCAVTTAFGVVNNDAQIKVGQSVLIFGIGGVGLNLAQAASMVSAHPIIGVDLKQHKLEMGKSLPLHLDKVLTGSHGGDAVPDLEIPRYIRLIEAKKMSLDGLITHEFSLEKINDALDLVRSGEAGRVMLSMT